MNPLFQKDLGRIFFQEKQPSSRLLLLLFLGTAIGYLWLKFGYHELWKDEWQAWHVARDMSWVQMLQFLYYEGHPSLWYIYLKIFTICCPRGMDLYALQLAHALTAVAAFFVLFFRFRFSIWLKLATAFSYFCFFEYGMVNRGYALLILLAFVASVLMQKRRKNNLLLATLLVLLCQTEAQGVLIAGALLIYFLSEKLLKDGFLATLKDSDNRLELLAFVLGLSLFVLSVWPRGEAEDLARAYNMMKQPLSLSIPLAFQGLLANTFWVGSISDTAANGMQLLGIVFSTLILSWLLYFFWEKKRVFIAFLAGLLAFFAFAAFVYGGGLRQWGLLFVLFVVLLNFYASENAVVNPIRAVFLILVFGFQLYYSSLAIIREIQFPFSNAEKTAEFLSANVPSKVPIVAINPFENGAVTGYLGPTKKVYTMPGGEPYTWFKWLSKVYIPSESELKLFAQYKGVGGIIVLSPLPLPPQRFPDATLWKSFDSFSIKNENFYIYTLPR